MPSSDTQFKKGKPGGPGRPKGSVCGRKKALAVLDEILGDENNLKLLRKRLQEMVDKDPVKVLTQLGYPMMPKDAVLSITDGDGEGIVLNVQINGNGNKCDS